MNNRNYEKELGIAQQKLAESIAREIMLTAMLDDANAEKEELKKLLDHKK